MKTSWRERYCGTPPRVGTATLRNMLFLGIATTGMYSLGYYYSLKGFRSQRSTRVILEQNIIVVVVVGQTVGSISNKTVATTVSTLEMVVSLYNADIFTSLI